MWLDFLTSLSFQLNFKFNDYVIIESLVGFILSLKFIYLPIVKICFYFMSFLLYYVKISGRSPFLFHPRRFFMDGTVSFTESQVHARHCCGYFGANGPMI